MSNKKFPPSLGSQKIPFTYILVAIFIGIFAFNTLTTLNTKQVSYDQFHKHLTDGEIEEITIGDTQIYGILKNQEKFVTVRLEPDLAKELAPYGVKVTRLIENNWLTQSISWILPALIFIGIWIFIMRKFAEKGGMGGGFMTVGKSKAKIFVETDLKIAFKDVAGVDEAIIELKEVVDFLKEPQGYGRLGAKIPKGVLLVGPPGTGKTLLAKAVAGEASVPFFTISGSEFVELFVGVGAARVRDLFDQARKKAPCIIFIDELDALGKARSANPMTGSHDEKEQTLNQLLVELDGFDSSSGVVLLAATNRPEILDPALLRAGRFDRQILVDRPDRLGRIDILKIHVKSKKLGEDVDLEKVASLTPGFTGADLANLTNEAALIATRRKADFITAEDFTNSIERIVAGLEKRNRLLNLMERKTVAFHEMGHAIVNKALPGCDRVHKISIIPRGIGSLGYTIQSPTEDRYLMTEEELLNKITVLMGGRASEELVFNHSSTGASDDISRATEIARAIVTRYGMDDTLGQVAYESEASKTSPASELFFKTRTYSEETAREIDCAVKNLVSTAFERAKTILEFNKSVLVEAAELLLERETLTREECEPLFKRISLAVPQESRSRAPSLLKGKGG